MESDQEINQRELSELPEEPLLPLRNFFPDEASETLAILAKRSSLMEEIRRTDNKFDIFDIKEEIIKVEGEIWQAKVKAAILGSVVNFLESREKIVLALRNFDTRVKNNDGTYILDTDYYGRIINEALEQRRLSAKGKFQYGFLTLKEIGQVIGPISGERVRQIETKALRKVSEVITDEDLLFYCKIISQDNPDTEELLKDFRKKYRGSKNINDDITTDIATDIPLRDRDIYELELPTRIRTALLRAGVKTVGSLVDLLDQIPDSNIYKLDYYHIRLIGQKGMTELKLELSNYLANMADRD